MRRGLIESYYEEYQWELERFFETDPEMFSLKAEIEFEKLWEKQYLSSGDIALIAGCGIIGVALAESCSNSGALLICNTKRNL